jgi:hypothetical protein
VEQHSRGKDEYEYKEKLRSVCAQTVKILGMFRGDSVTLYNTVMELLSVE